MYHFVASGVPTARPLQGMIGLGAVTSFYRLPSYSCLDNQVTLQSAKERCDARTPGLEVKYFSKKAPGKSGTKTDPYHVTIADLYTSTFDVCKARNLKICAPPPAPPQALPPPLPPPAPPPPANQPTPDEDGFIQLEVPQIRTPVYKPEITAEERPQETTPWVIIPEQAPTPAMQYSAAPTRVSDSTIVIEEPEEEEPPEESSDRTALVVGGVLLLVAGGGLAYYLTTRKKRRR